MPASAGKQKLVKGLKRADQKNDGDTHQSLASFHELAETVPVNAAHQNVRKYDFGIILFFFNDTAPTEIYPLSLHDALPISRPSELVSTQKLGEFQCDPRRWLSGR